MRNTLTSRLICRNIKSANKHSKEIVVLTSVYNSRSTRIENDDAFPSCPHPLQSLLGNQHLTLHVHFHYPPPITHRRKRTWPQQIHTGIRNHDIDWPKFRLCQLYFIYDGQL